jgi:hypothetical protein
MDVSMIDERVVSIVTDWLVKAQPVRWTGRSSTARNTRPLALFQACVKDTALFWFDKYRYAPERGKEAGSKAPVYPFFRAALPVALRRFRSITERVPLDEIPEVSYSQRRVETTRDGAASNRALVGFETRQPPLPPQILPTSPYLQEEVAIDADVCPPHELEEAEGLEALYHAALSTVLDAPPAPAPEASPVQEAPAMAVEAVEAVPMGKKKRVYLCKRCKVPKKGHTCVRASGDALETGVTGATRKRKAATANRASAKRRRVAAA